MSKLLKIQALFLGSALLMFGGGLQGLLLSVRGAEEGFSTFALGLIGTGWSAGFIAGSLGVPMMVKRVGHIRAYSVMAAMGTITILLNLLWINDVGWILLRVFSGFCFAGAAMIVESWLNEVSDNKSRGSVFSIYVTINLIASTVGQLTMSITGVQGHLPFILGGLAFICALLPMALTTSPQPRPLASSNIDLRLLLKTSPVALVASFCVGMTNGTFGTLAPVFGFYRGLGSSEIAYLMSIPIILGAISQIPFGRLSDRIDRRWVMIILAVLGGIAGLAMLAANPSGWGLYFVFGLYGFAAFPIYGIAVAHANDFAGEGDFAGIASGMLVTYGVGLAIGPAVAALMMNATQPVALFAMTAAFHVLLAVFAFIRMRVRPVNLDQEREEFRIVPIKTSTPATVALDPRSDEDQPNEE